MCREIIWEKLQMQLQTDMFAFRPRRSQHVCQFWQCVHLRISYLPNFQGKYEDSEERKMPNTGALFFLFSPISWPKKRQKRKKRLAAAQSNANCSRIISVIILERMVVSALRSCSRECQESFVGTPRKCLGEWSRECQEIGSALGSREDSLWHYQFPWHSRETLPGALSSTPKALTGALSGIPHEALL